MSIFIKSFNETSVFVIVSFRFLVPAFFLSLVKFNSIKSFLKAPNKKLLLASFLTSLRILLWVLGFMFASINKAIIILYTWPIILTFLSIVFLKEKIGLKQKIILITAFIGIVIIYSGEDFSFQNNDLIGMLLMLLVAFINAINTVIFKQELTKHSPSDIIIYDNFIGLIIFIPFLFINFNSLDFHTISLGLTYGLLIGLLGYLLTYYGLSKIKASIAGILSYAEVGVQLF